MESALWLMVEMLLEMVSKSSLISPMAVVCPWTVAFISSVISKVAPAAKITGTMAVSTKLTDSDVEVTLKSWMMK